MSYPVPPADPVEALRERAEHGRLELPVLPAAAAEVLASVDGDDCDARSLAALVQRDPSLAAHVLRVANSARFAPREPIVSLTQAIGRLGLVTLREIVVSVAVKGAVFNVQGHESLVDRLWLHSLTTGRLAQEIARARRASVEAAFLSGLLHDIGAPIALHALADICQRSGAVLTPERLAAAIDELHAPIGARLVDEWGLPAWVREAVLHHHAPEGAPRDAALIRTVALADVLADWLIEQEGAGAPPGLEHAEALDLYDEDLAELGARGLELLAETSA